MNYKPVIVSLLDKLNELQSLEIYDEDLLVQHQQRIQYYLNLLNMARYLDNINYVENEKYTSHTVADGEDIFRLANTYYNTYEGAEKFIMDNEIDDIFLVGGQILKIY